MSDHGDGEDTENTRASWNAATRVHNAHKGDQARFFREGGDTLFPEELALLGDVSGKRVAHLQCNAGQDSLSLARRGAVVTGVDFSSEAVSFARALSRDAGIAADFVEAEVVSWLSSTSERFDIAFASYGVTGWLRDLPSWARGVARVLEPGGRFVYVEFHPVLWSVGKPGAGGAAPALDGDDYFADAPFRDPVGDYVGASGAALGAVDAVGAEDAPPTPPSRIPATSWQHPLATVVTALVDAGLALTVLREWPYANGCRVHASLVVDDARRWHWPPGVARVPLMYGLVAQR